jgi:hypothetical protein
MTPARPLKACVQSLQSRQVLRQAFDGSKNDIATVKRCKGRAPRDEDTDNPKIMAFVGIAACSRSIEAHE